MNPPTYNYDETSDTLYVVFEPGEKATGIELNEHILLRINKRERKAVGLTFFDYSVLSQKTDFGPRSFPLSGLTDLPEDLRDLVIEILSCPPVTDVLYVSLYTPTAVNVTPITSLQPSLAAVP